MPLIASGANATVSLNPGDTIAVEPKEKAAVVFENPVGTIASAFSDKRTFGPYKTARSVKVTSIQGSIFYEVSTAKSMGSATLSQDPDVGVFWGTGAPSISAGKGSLYLRLDGSSTSTRMYVNTDGATTWTNVVTAA